jgi:hypothetical protein
LLSNDRETNNETTALLGNRYLLNKYTQPSLNNAFGNKYVPTATNPHATIEELLETVYSTRSVPRCYKQDNLSKLSAVSRISQRATT